MTESVHLLRTAFAHLERRDIDGCLELLSDDFRMNLAGLPDPLSGKESWRANAAYLLEAFSDVSVGLDDALICGDRVTCMITMTATHTGEFLGHSATGRRISWTSFEIYRINNDLICEEWICSDLYSLERQLQMT